MSDQADLRRLHSREPRQARGQARVDAILDACARLIAEHGRQGVKMHRLAREAGTSIGSLYHFFPDRESVLQALLVRHRGALIEIRQRLEAVPDADWRACSAAQWIDRLFEPYLHYFRRHPDFLQFVRITPDAEPPLRDAEQEQAVHEVFGKVVALRLPRASQRQQSACAATLLSLPLGMLKQQLLDYDPLLREAILRDEIPRALRAYGEAIERTYG